MRWHVTLFLLMPDHLHALLAFSFFSSRRRHTRFDCDWSSDVCSSDLAAARPEADADLRRDAGLLRHCRHVADLPSGEALLRAAGVPRTGGPGGDRRDARIDRKSVV